MSKDVHVRGDLTAEIGSFFVHNPRRAAEPAVKAMLAANVLAKVYTDKKGWGEATATDPVFWKWAKELEEAMSAYRAAEKEVSNGTAK